MLIKHYQRRIVIILFDFFSISLAYYFSFALRYDSLFIDNFKAPQFHLLFLLNITLQLCSILLMGVHKGLWRFASTSDLVLIIKSIAIATTAAFIGTFLFDRLETTPRSIYFIDSILLVIFLGGGRFAYRMLKQSSKITHTENAILIGAGVAGEQLIREYKKNPTSVQYNISCILDDDKEKRHRTIHGVKVTGGIPDLKYYISKYSASIVLIAIPSAKHQTISKIFNLAKELNAKVNTLPPIIDLLSGKVSFKHMREVQVEDLMGRSVVKLDLESIGRSHTKQVVMITGGGGSIGSELCRQVLLHNPSQLIIVDNSEFNIYTISEELGRNDYKTEILFFTASVFDKEHMDNLFKEFCPTIVYHAAAYKHVPIMEFNPLSAIKTNILGTNTVAELAIENNTKQFILISSDKAVNPTNVMGTTKRVAEMICEYHQAQNKTNFSMVRFGNVLGSSGSVIPKFKQQILKGGPVTITHPDITRYFMSIPEAAQLVIQAGSLAKGGEIFVLDMGEPIKIVDLAKELIGLSGFEANAEIKIEFTGLRAGEKLYEELLMDTESTLPTSHNLVHVSKTRCIPKDFEKQYNKLISLSFETSRDDVKKALNDLVKEYVPEFENNTLSQRELI